MFWLIILKMFRAQEYRKWGKPTPLTPLNLPMVVGEVLMRYIIIKESLFFCK